MLQTREFVKSFLKDKTFPLLSGPLFVIVHYRIPAPSTITYKKRLLQNKLPHIKKPDGDNLEKFLNDALNGIVWTDDSNIAWILRSKSITASKTGSTTIFIRQLPSHEQDYQTIINDIQDHIDVEE
jgi:Holliday junction resolvase RusA-like endonuclease